MPAAPGETLLTTLFADIHYSFTPPTSRPQHHSFTRASYVYLFHSPSTQQAKVEIANNAGTSDQTAFSGYLQNLASLTYSYKQSNVITLTVDGGSIQGHETWHLPAFNERNDVAQKYLYKIHTLDIYLWTEKDAVTLLGLLKNLLPAERVIIKDAPPPRTTTPASSTLKKPTLPAEHRDSMSPVVQQLERTAVSEQYTPQSTTSDSNSNSFPGPPTPATSPPQQQAAPMAYNPAAPAAPEPIMHREKTPPPVDGEGGTGLAGAGKYDQQQQFGGGGVGSPPNMFPSSQQPGGPQHSFFSGSPAPSQQQMRNPSLSFPGPPQGTPPPGGLQKTQNTSFPPPPPPNGGPSPQPYNPSFAPPPTQHQQPPGSQGQGQPTSPPPSQQSFHRQSSFGAPPVQQYANYNPSLQHQQSQTQSQTPSFGPAAVASPGMQPPQGQQQQLPPTPSAPPAYSSPMASPANLGQQQQGFGYSGYNYSQSQQQQSQQSQQAGQYAGYDVHNQAYRPTAEEASGVGYGSYGTGGVGAVYGGQGGVRTDGGVRPDGLQRTETSERRMKLEGKVRDMEGKAGKYLKRLDKLW